MNVIKLQLNNKINKDPFIRTTQFLFICNLHYLLMELKESNASNEYNKMPLLIHTRGSNIHGNNDACLRVCGF